MNQLFYNIAGGIEHQIRREKGQQYQKWLFALSEILCKIGIGFTSNFRLKVPVLHLTILKRKNLSFLLKVETDQFVICLVLPECLSIKICCISPSNSEANRDSADAESPFPLFLSFSASFKNSSPREKVGNCLRFETGGWSLCFYPLWSRNIWIFFPTLTMAACAKKKKIRAKRFAHAISEHYRDLEHAYVYWIWLHGSASYVIKDIQYIANVRLWRFLVKSILLSYLE